MDAEVLEFLLTLHYAIFEYKYAGFFYWYLQEYFWSNHFPVKPYVIASYAHPVAVQSNYSYGKKCGVFVIDSISYEASLSI